MILLLIFRRNMSSIWSENIDNFISFANKEKLRFILIGGGAVNFHGYQRHSADVDFWIETTDENLEKLKVVFQSMGYDVQSFPDRVKNKQQNISIKFSPNELSLELVTSISLNKSFDDAYNDAETVTIEKEKILKWRVLSYKDLIDNKLKSMRPKDILDVKELQRIHKL